MNKDIELVRHDLSRFSCELGNEKTLARSFLSVPIAYRDFLREFIFELEEALHHREAVDHITSRYLELKTENGALQEKVQFLEESLQRLTAELKEATTNRASTVDTMASELLAVAQAKHRALDDINEQWQSARRDVPEDRSRDIDKIYKGILNELQEQL